MPWLKDIEKEAEKTHVNNFDQNNYCTYDEKDRELERYPESKTEPPQRTERQRNSSSRSGHGQQTAGGSFPQQGASSGGASANDPNKIDNEIIDSIFRMNSGGDDDRWEIISVAAFNPFAPILVLRRSVGCMWRQADRIDVHRGQRGLIYHLYTPQEVPCRFDLSAQVIQLRLVLSKADLV